MDKLLLDFLAAFPPNGNFNGEPPSNEVKGLALKIIGEMRTAEGKEDEIDRLKISDEVWTTISPILRVGMVGLLASLVLD